MAVLTFWEMPQDVCPNVIPQILFSPSFFQKKILFIMLYDILVIFKKMVKIYQLLTYLLRKQKEIITQEVIISYSHGSLELLLKLTRFSLKQYIQIVKEYIFQKKEKLVVSENPDMKNKEILFLRHANNLPLSILNAMLCTGPQNSDLFLRISFGKQTVLGIKMKQMKLFSKSR